MHRKNLLIFIRAFLGIVLLGVGLWLFAFFKRESIYYLSSYDTPEFLVSFFSPKVTSKKMNLATFLIQNHTVLGIILISVGFVVGAGLTNYVRFILGLILIFIGLFIYNYFLPERMTNGNAFALSTYIAPAISLLGLGTMLVFEKRDKRRVKRQTQI